MKDIEKGFSLIEIMVVISIIGLLASILVATFSISMGKSRDSRRKLDLNQIYYALNLYYDDRGCLPRSSGSGCPGAESYNEVDGGGWDYSSQGAFLPFLVSNGYLTTVPVDPINNGTGDVLYTGSGYAYNYYCHSNTRTLTLGAKLETGGIYYKAYQVPGFNCR